MTNYCIFRSIVFITKNSETNVWKMGLFLLCDIFRSLIVCVVYRAVLKYFIFIEESGNHRIKFVTSGHAELYWQHCSPDALWHFLHF